MPAYNQLLKELGSHRYELILAGGLVNPFGPTLAALLLRGETTPTLHRLILNPFHQDLTCLHSGKGADGVPVTALISELGLIAAPTLLFFGELNGEELFACAKQIAEKSDNFTSLLDGLRRFHGDPWKRVAKETHAGDQVLMGYTAGQPVAAKNMLPRTISDADVSEYLSLITEAKNANEEMLAFLAAWRGSIELQRSSGNLDLVRQAMPPDEIEKAISLIMTMKKGRPQYAGYTDRLFYRSLASDLNAGRMTTKVNGKVVSEDEARRLVAHARAYGWL